MRTKNQKEAAAPVKNSASQPAIGAAPVKNSASQPASGAAPVKNSDSQPAIGAAPVGAGARRLISASPTSPSYKSYMQKGIGLNYGQHPALIDDCLDRAILDMWVVSGSGNVVTDEADQQAVLHPSIVGVDTELAPPTYQVSVNYAEESGKWVVNASAGVTWAVLILKQKAKQ